MSVKKDSSHTLSQRMSHFVIDGLSMLSIVGIWPRFIEPKLLATTHLKLNHHAFSHLAGLRIVHFSDLHFRKKISKRFLNKLASRIQQAHPDLILFSGDFLCYSKLEAPDLLKEFLNKLRAPLGSYCVLGNHDYDRYVTLLPGRVYGCSLAPNPLMSIARALRKLRSQETMPSSLSSIVYEIPDHQELVALLQQTPFTLLENATIQLPVGLNLTGLGDFSLGRCVPEAAFKNYDLRFPGIVLSHNPDTFPRLCSYPGNLVLAGHTHGEQIHFPFPSWLRKLTQKLASLDYPDYTRGLWKKENKLLYVNRGVGGHKPFRFCSPPELLIIEIGKDARPN